MLPNRMTLIYLVELNMIYLNVFFGMDWLHACFAFIYCRTNVVKFNFLNELVV